MCVAPGDRERLVAQEAGDIRERGAGREEAGVGDVTQVVEAQPFPTDLPGGSLHRVRDAGGAGDAAVRHHEHRCIRHLSPRMKFLEQGRVDDHLPRLTGLRVLDRQRARVEVDVLPPERE